MGYAQHGFFYNTKNATLSFILQTEKIWGRGEKQAGLIRSLLGSQLACRSSASHRERRTRDKIYTGESPTKLGQSFVSPSSLLRVRDGAERIRKVVFGVWGREDERCSERCSERKERE